VLSSARRLATGGGVQRLFDKRGDLIAEKGGGRGSRQRGYARVDLRRSEDDLSPFEAARAHAILFFQRVMAVRSLCRGGERGAWRMEGRRKIVIDRPHEEKKEKRAEAGVHTSFLRPRIR